MTEVISEPGNRYPAAVAFGVGALVGQHAIQDPEQVLAHHSLLYLELAFVFGVGTSVLSGLYPA